MRTAVFLLSLALIPAFIFTAEDVAAGGWSGNGGDQTKDQFNPWFLTTESDPPVTYCINASKTYPVANLDKMVADAIHMWTNFLMNQEIYDVWLGGEARGWQFWDMKPRKIASNFRHEKSCTNEVDLKILFGVKDSVVEEYLKSSDYHLLGVSLREKYNHVSYRNKGVIWISEQQRDGSPWIRNENYVKQQLLHELGHLFGMKHNSTYVMDERIADVLTSSWDTNLLDQFIPKIEIRTWAYQLWGAGIWNGVDLYEGYGIKSDAEPIYKLTCRENGLMPAGFRRLLGLGDQQGLCHTFEVVNVGRSDEKGDRFAMSLRIMEFDGNTAKVVAEFEVGDLQSAFRNGAQPAGYWTNTESNIISLYTNWYDPLEPNRAKAFTQPFGEDPISSKWIDLPARGTTTIYGVKFVITIDRLERGLIFRMFNAQANEWLEVVSPYFVQQIGPRWYGHAPELD